MKHNAFLALATAAALSLWMSATVSQASAESDGQGSDRTAEATAPRPKNRSRTTGVRRKAGRVRRNVGLGRAEATDVDRAVEGSDAFDGSTASVQAALGDLECQANDDRAARISDRNRFYVADDFAVTTSGQITSVAWRGAYADALRDADCVSQVSGDSFHIRYYTDAGGVPGTLIGFFTQQPAGAQPLNVTSRVATGNRIAGVADEYEYTASHGPLLVEAGQCYWIEITNAAILNTQGTDCAWQWEAAFPGNDQGVQSPEDADYLTNDWIPFDFAFCLDVALGDSAACVPPPPANDECVTAEPVSGTGTFEFDNTFARTDPLAHALCVASGTAEFDADVWFCWTAPCSGAAYVSTCGTTDLDTRLAVYEGCDGCPPAEGALVSCNDDRCGNEDTPFQSLAAFFAAEGQQYLIRVGVFPGQLRGAATLAIECDPPDHAECPGFGNCFSDNGTPGCEVADCCSLVCVCDPYCCETTWDQACATTGSGAAPGCGAQILCSGCGSPSSGDCCTATPDTPGCSDTACCLAVCNADNYCCQNEWDEACATDGVNHSGSGARVLCPALCALDGDLDGSGSVDGTDWGMFVSSCFGGPAAAFVDPTCGAADFNGDERIDLHDVSGFMQAFNPPAP